MKQLEKIRNAARELHALHLSDQRKYDAVRKQLSPEKKQEMRERLWNFENALRSIEQSINELAPFEVAADQAARSPRQDKTTFYRQIFERESFRKENNSRS